MNQTQTLKEKVYEAAHILYREHDLKSTQYEAEINKIIKLALDDIKEHPCLEVIFNDSQEAQFCLRQIILENFG